MRFSMLSAGIALILLVSQTDLRLKSLPCQADLIVLGEVVEVGPPPGFWSGQFPAAQALRYKVTEVLKGELAVNKLDIQIFVVQNDPLSDREKPMLSPRIFSKGKVHVLFLKRPIRSEAETKSRASDGTFFSASDVYSVVPMTEELIRSIRQTNCERENRNQER